jgi:hypothetical protein
VISKPSREHLLLPDVFIASPDLVVDIFREDELLQSFGLYQASLDDLDKGLLFRIVLLTGCHLLEHEVFSECRAVLRWEDEECELSFDPDSFSFIQ